MSTNASPPLSSGLGAFTSTRSTSRPAGLRCAAQVVPDVGDRDLDDFGCVPSGRGRDHDPRRRLLAVADDRGQRGGLVVADARDGHVQQRVEQLALALLELAGDHDTDLRVGDARPAPRRAARRRSARSLSLGDPAGVVDQLDDDLDLAGGHSVASWDILF